MNCMRLEDTWDTPLHWTEIRDEKLEDKNEPKEAKPVAQGICNET